MLETWKAVPGYEGVYEVSDHGNCRRLTSKWGRIRAVPFVLKTYVEPRGYVQAALSVHGVQKATHMHCLVASAFLGERPHGMQIAHLDGNPSNNAVSNLKYVTPTENESHKADHGTRRVGEQLGHAKLTADAVRAIRKAYRRGKRGLGYRSLGKLFGVNGSAIRMVVLGKQWTHVA
jgi:hypothetical protein